MTNFKRTVRADCAVPACRPLPGSIKALTLCLSDKLKQTSPSDNNFTKIISHWKIFVKFLPFTETVCNEQIGILLCIGKLRANILNVLCFLQMTRSWTLLSMFYCFLVSLKDILSVKLPKALFVASSHLWVIDMGKGFPVGASSKEPVCQCRRLKRCGFEPWIGKTPWRRAWQPTPVFLPGESHGQRSLAGYGP